MKVEEVSVWAAAVATGPRTILLIGLNDAAKQLTGNCLLSISRNSPPQQQQQQKVDVNISHPFTPRSNTTEAQCSAYMSDNERLVVIDAYGLGDRRVDQNNALGLLQKSLAAVRNQVHLVLVVFKQRDIVNDELLSYIRFFNKRVLFERTRAKNIDTIPNLAFVCDDDDDDGDRIDGINQKSDQLLRLVAPDRIFRFDLDSESSSKESQSSRTPPFGKRSSSLQSFDSRLEESQRLLALVDKLAPLDLAHVQGARFVAEMARDTRNLFVQDSLTAKHKRRIILVGNTGAGKSTVANCLYNKLPTLYHVQSHPFETSDSANGCTSNATVLSNGEVVLIDTVGFGDPRFDQTSVIEAFQQGLAMLNNTVDLVIFVIKRDRIGHHIADFFEHIHDELFRGLMRNNSMLVCSGCQKGWLAEHQVKNEPLKRVLSICADRSVEFKLDFNIPDIEMPPAVRDAFEGLNEQARQKAIDTLVAKVHGLNVSKVNLDYIQESRFKKLFLERIALKLIDANTQEFVKKPLAKTARKGMIVVSAGWLVSNLFIEAYLIGNILSCAYLSLEGLISFFFSSATIGKAAKCLVSFQFN